MASRRRHRGERASEQDVAVVGVVVERPVQTQRKAPAASFVALGPRATCVSRSVTIARPRREVFTALRDPEVEARIMRGIPNVELDASAPDRTRWIVRGRFGLERRVQTEIVEVVDDERIAWRSPFGARVAVAGVVNLADAPGCRGTEVRATLAYEMPWGFFGRLLGKLLWPAAGELLRGALRHLQQLLEVGEIATIDGQPSGKRARRGR